LFVFSFLQGAVSDEEDISASSELKDLEFKLLHDLTKLQVGMGTNAIMNHWYLTRE